MALKRLDSCRHFTDGSGFVKCLTYYEGDSGDKKQSWEICVLRSEMPVGQQANPTDANVQAVADPRANTLYTAWKTAVDADTIAEAKREGQSATIA